MTVSRVIETHYYWVSQTYCLPKRETGPQPEASFSSSFRTRFLHGHPRNCSPPCTCLTILPRQPAPVTPNTHPCQVHPAPPLLSETPPFFPEDLFRLARKS